MPFHPLYLLLFPLALGAWLGIGFFIAPKYLIITLAILLLLNFILNNLYIRILLLILFLFGLNFLSSIYHKNIYEDKLISIPKEEKVYTATIKECWIDEDADKGCLAQIIEQNININIKLTKSAALKDIHAQDIVIFKSKIRPFAKPLHKDDFDGFSYGLINHIHGTAVIKDYLLIEKVGEVKAFFSLNRLKERLRENILQHITIKEAGLLLPLMTGDTKLMAAHDKKAFANIGVNHLLAVSGLQVSILAIIFYCILNFIFSNVSILILKNNSNNLAFIITLLFISLFAITRNRYSIIKFFSTSLASGHFYHG